MRKTKDAMPSRLLQGRSTSSAVGPVGLVWVCLCVCLAVMLVLLFVLVLVLVLLLVLLLRLLLPQQMGGSVTPCHISFVCRGMCCRHPPLLPLHRLEGFRVPRVPKARVATVEDTWTYFKTREEERLHRVGVH